MNSQTSDNEVKFIVMYAKALKAGNDAGDTHDPDNWFPCGGGGVLVKPRNSKFARWLVENELGRDSSGNKAIIISTGRYNQSMNAQQSWASAIAEVLRDNNIKATTWIYID